MTGVWCNALPGWPPMTGVWCNVLPGVAPYDWCVV